jgi:ATP phosphoribosyltransferase
MTDRLAPSTLRLGLPSGSLQASTIELFGRAGYRVSVQERSVFPRIDDEKLSAVLFRAQEISRYVVDGIIDCGLTGYDWIVENGNENDVREIDLLARLGQPGPLGLGRSRRKRHPQARGL